MPKQQICENLHFDSTSDELILTIKQRKSFIFKISLIARVKNTKLTPKIKGIKTMNSV